jgi:hypothetical protein
MIIILVLFSISLNTIQSQIVNKYNIPGDLISISGDRYTIVIVDTNLGYVSRLSILRKTG